jgi:GxxExxY protein
MGVKQQIILAEEAITRSIIGAFYEVYNILRFGFSESVYQAALERELIARGHIVAREVSVRVYYKGEAIAWQRVDMLVDNKVIVETKSTFLLSPTARPQLQNYLRATNLSVGLLLHFGPRAEFFREYSATINNSSR